MWSKVGIGGEHHRYYKHNKFRQNPRGDPKFLVDLTRNDPISICLVLYLLNLSHSVTIVFKQKIKDNPSYSATFRYYLRVLYYNINACALNNTVVEYTTVE